MSMVPAAGSWQHQARSPGDGKLLAHSSNTAVKLSPGHHSTLPRKKTLPLTDATVGGRTTSNSSSSATSVQQQQFQRGQPLRRSCLSPTQQQQQQQLPPPPPPHHHPHHHQQQQQHRQQDSSLHFEYFVPRSVSEFNLAAAVTDVAVPPPPPVTSVLRPPSAIVPPAPVATGVIGTTSQTRLLDGSSSGGGGGGGGGGCNTATRSREKMVTFEDEGVSCGVTSTPTRKNLPTLDNVFMWRVPQISRMMKRLLCCGWIRASEFPYLESKETSDSSKCRSIVGRVSFGNNGRKIKRIWELFLRRINE